MYLISDSLYLVIIQVMKIKRKLNSRYVDGIPKIFVRMRYVGKSRMRIPKARGVFLYVIYGRNRRNTIKKKFINSQYWLKND